MLQLPDTPLTPENPEEPEKVVFFATKENLMDDLKPIPVTQIGTELMRALDRMIDHPLCLELLAENMLYAGGIERFFQRLFLWAFVTSPSSEYAMELEAKFEPLEKYASMDLACFRKTPAYRQIADNGFLSPKQATEHCSAIVEMKDNWNRRSIPGDLKKLREIRQHALKSHGNEIEIYEVLIIGNHTYDPTFALKKSIVEHTQETIKVVRNAESVSRVDVIETRRLLDCAENPSDLKAWVSLDVIILRVHFN